MWEDFPGDFCGRVLREVLAYDFRRFFGSFRRFLRVTLQVFRKPLAGDL